MITQPARRSNSNQATILGLMQAFADAASCCVTWGSGNHCTAVRASCLVLQTGVKLFDDGKSSPPVVTMVDRPRYVKMPVLPYFFSPSFNLPLLRPNEPHIPPSAVEYLLSQLPMAVAAELTLFVGVLGTEPGNSSSSNCCSDVG